MVSVPTPPPEPVAPAPAPALAPEPVRTRTPLPTGFATLRDVLLFIAGMAIIVNEVFISAKVEPAAVGLGIALTGAPLVFGADEKKGSK